MVDPQPHAGSTFRDLVQQVLGGEPSLTTSDVAARSGQELEVVRGYWRALGFADLPDDEPHFSDADVRMLGELAALVNSGTIGLGAAQTLVRAQGHSADRLALWQIEALVEDAAERFRLDDTSARLVVLDRIAVLAPVLEYQLVQVWRRQLVALLGRLERDVGTAHSVPEVADQLPLERAVGFFDMVSFTERSAGLSSAELAELVQGFEGAARDTIAAHGARVVKTIGDAVLFVADDLRTGSAVAHALLQVMTTAGFAVRGSLVWGRVLSRSGDIFGPSVNLASRLADVAPPGTVVLDDVSAALLEAGGFEGQLLPQQPVAVQGLGTIRPVQLSWLGED